MEELQNNVRLAQQGDLNAYDVIVRRFQDMATGFAYAVLEDFHLAEDAAQEAFVRAFLDLHQLREPAAFPGWFRQTVLNCCRLIRRGRRAQWMPVDEALPAPGHSPAEEYQLREREEQVRQAVADLPERLRQVTVLFYISDYSQKDIAAFLGVPVSTVKKRLYDARKRLAERMLEMVEETFVGHRPSKDDAFTEQVAAMILAAFQGDAATVSQLLEANAELAHVRGTVELFWGGEFEPLHLAAASGSNEIVERLLKAGVDIDTVGGINWTPLTLAIWRNQQKTIELLIERGATVDLYSAVQLDEEERVRAILAQDPEQVYISGPEGNKPLSSACSARVARLLLEAGAASDADALLDALKSAAGEVWLQGRKEVAELLIKQGAPVDIYTAVKLDDVGRVRALLNEDDQLVHAAAHDHGDTPLHHARSVEVAQLLIERGAGLEMVSQHHLATPLVMAVHTWCIGRNGRELADFLLQQGAKVPTIQIACALGDLQEVERFLAEVPALVNKAGDSPDLWAGYTPLHMAVNNGSVELVRHLIEAGADLETRSTILGKTALEWAERRGRNEIAQLLRERGAKG